MPEPAGTQQVGPDHWPVIHTAVLQAQHQVNRAIALVEPIPRVLQSRSDRRDVPPSTSEQRKTISTLLAHFKTNDYWDVTNIRDGYHSVLQWLQTEGINRDSYRLVPSDSLESFAGEHSGDLFGLAYEGRIYLPLEFYFAGEGAVTLDVSDSTVDGATMPPLARTLVHEVCHIVFTYSVGVLHQPGAVTHIPDNADCPPGFTQVTTRRSALGDAYVWEFFSYCCSHR